MRALRKISLAPILFALTVVLWHMATPHHMDIGEGKVVFLSVSGDHVETTGAGCDISECHHCSDHGCDKNNSLCSVSHSYINDTDKGAIDVLPFIMVESIVSQSVTIFKVVEFIDGPDPVPLDGSLSVCYSLRAPPMA